jgi:AcrR family transcriptional regulator
MKNEDRRARTIEAILTASLHTVETVGFSRLRTADIANSSGMSEGTLFRYYPSKLLLVVATLERSLELHIHRSLEEFEQLTRPLDHEVLLRMMWRILNHPKLAWTYELASAASTNDELRNAIGPIFHFTTDLTNDFAVTVLAELGIPEDDALNALKLAIWSMKALILRDLGRGESGAQDRLIPYLAAIARRTYGVEPTS